MVDFQRIFFLIGLKEIEITAGISVKVVEQFKLLGVTIDNKLRFEMYASMIKKSVNRKFCIIKLYHVTFHQMKNSSFSYCMDIVV